MTNETKYDLEERTTKFAVEIVRLCKTIRINPINTRIISQLVGSAGSVGANYREANDALGRKEFIQRLRIARKESKEAIHWLEILKVSEEDISCEIDVHIKEALEIRNILSAIIKKSL